MWEFAEDVLHVHVSEGVVYLWTTTTMAVRLQLLPDVPDDSVGYPVCMDFKQEISTADVLLDRNDYTFVAQSVSDDYIPGRVVTPLTVVAEGADFRYTFDTTAPDMVLAGVKFATELVPNKPLAKDWRGNIKPGAKIVLHKYVVDYVNSGEIRAFMDNVYRSDERIIVVDSGVFPLDDSPVDNFSTTIFSGSFDIPWGEDTSQASLS